MNKVLLIGRLTRDPETRQTTSGIKYSRFTIAINRATTDNQADFVPVVVWRNQAEFVERYIKKGALVSIDGRFTSSSYVNSDNQNVTRYEITAERIEGLESRSVRERANNNSNSSFQTSNSLTQEVRVKESSQPTEVKFEKESEENDVPWELDL